MFQSRFTVDSEIPITWAVSSMDRPEKNRSSTTRLCWGSIRARSLSASSRATMSRSGLAEGSSTLSMASLMDGAAALAGIAAARVFHQDLAHEVRRDAEEMGAIFPLRRRIAGESHERFVDEGRALQGVAGAFAAKITMRQAAHFVVDQRHERLQRFLVSGTPSDKQFSNWGSSGVEQRTGSGYGVPKSTPNRGQNTVH